MVSTIGSISIISTSKTQFKSQIGTVSLKIQFLNPELKKFTDVT